MKCDVPGCASAACETGPEGNFCGSHLEPWQRRDVCVHCHATITDADGRTPVTGGAYLHNACVDAWADQPGRGES